MHQIFTQMYLTVFPELSHMESPTRFLQAPAAPSILVRLFPIFHYRSSSFFLRQALKNLHTLFFRLKQNSLFSSIRQAGKTRVTNSQAATHESWLVRCSCHTPGFSRSNLHVYQNLTFVFSSKLLGCHCQLSAVDCCRC